MKGDDDHHDMFGIEKPTEQKLKGSYGDFVIEELP